MRKRQKRDMRQHLIVREADAFRTVEQADAAFFQKTGKVVVLVQKNDRTMTIITVPRNSDIGWADDCRIFTRIMSLR